VVEKHLRFSIVNMGIIQTEKCGMFIVSGAIVICATVLIGVSILKKKPLQSGMTGLKNEKTCSLVLACHLVFLAFDFHSNVAR
jgi:hypothetical protein